MSSYRVRYLLTAPIIVVAGLTAAFWGRRAVAFGNTARHWVDSLDRGSGPVTITVPMPIYISGTRVGNLDTVVVQRHARKSLDSLRIVVRPLASANLTEFTTCALRVEPLDQVDVDNYQRALVCASDTSGLTRFGTLSFGAGHTNTLYMDTGDVACMAPDVAEAPDAPPAPAAPPATKGRVVLKQTVTTHVACRIHQALSGADVQRLSRQLSRAQAQRIGEDVRRAAEAARAAGAAARH